VARLEREHGVTLFKRTSRSVVSCCSRAPSPCSPSSTWHTTELAELAGVITGRLRLGMIGSTGLAAPVVERTLAAFHHRHPAVEMLSPIPVAGTWPTDARR